MNRVVCLLVCCCLITSVFPGPRVVGGSPIEANVANLQEQLESGLKARRPEEFQFIAKVVSMVEDDELPLALVMSTFLWTRKNPKAKQYPFVYFQRALRERAKKLGITL